MTTTGTGELFGALSSVAVTVTVVDRKDSEISEGSIDRLTLVDSDSSSSSVSVALPELRPVAFPRTVSVSSPSSSVSSIGVKPKEWVADCWRAGMVTVWADCATW